MGNKIFIPQRINVGYQNRRDTYTGKLGYVTYFDEKGVLRKEKSWNNWRDASLGNNEYDNTPMSGFVLNKKAGGGRNSWFNRQTYCRVFDPRGFEFEITIDNLLYILECTDCLKGRGLVGEFVYAWDYTQLILIPTSSPDYTELVEKSERIANKKLTVKDLKVGFEYIGADDTTYVYMGKHDTFEKVCRYQNPFNPSEIKEAKQTWFVQGHDYQNIYKPVGKSLWFASRYPKYSRGGGKVEGEYEYDFKVTKSLPKNILTCTSEEQAQDYDKIKNRMEKEPKFSPPNPESLEFVPYTFEQFNEVAHQNSRYGRPCKFNDGIYSDTKVQYYLTMVEDDKVEIELNLTYGNDEFRVYGLGRTDFHEAVNDFKSRCKSISQYSDDRSAIGKGLKSKAYTLQEAFDILKPGYIRAYLKNGNHCMDLLKQ